jgi:hypothetical protein
MTEPLDEQQLKAEFRHLREAETRSAPGFRALVSGTALKEQQWRILPSMSLAATAAVLVLAITVWMNTDRDRFAPELAGDASPLTESMDRVANLEMPTDFLLETPWFELERTTPNFDFEFPQYDIPEDLTDET